MDTAHPRVAVGEWRWFHIYHWILALRHGRFVKYNHTLHHSLRAHDLIGSRLFTLTRSDWLTLGVSDLGDIQILLEEVSRIDSNSRSASDPIHDLNFSNSSDSDIESDPPIPTQPQNQEAIVDDGHEHCATATLNSLLYHNHLRQTALSQQCRHFYAYAVNVTHQLSAERSHRMMAEQALAEQAVQTQALREALCRCQTSATSVQSTMTAMAARTAHLERQITSRDAQIADYNELNNELKAQMLAVQTRMAERERAQTKKVRLWSVDECFLWMAAIDGGRFGRAYEDLYERLEVANVYGAVLERMGVEDMERVGIDDGCDQRRLICEIRVLLKAQREHSQQTEVSDAEEEDYDFADLELLSSSCGRMGGAY